MKNPSKQTQRYLEEIYSKYQLIPTIKAEFRKFLKDNNLESEDGTDTEFHLDVLTQICLHRQADVITMVGILSPKHGTPQEVADRLVMACEFDFLSYSMDTNKFSLMYDICDDTKSMLEKYQYPLPMIIPPEKVTKHKNTGYLTITNPIILNGSEYFDDKDVCFDHINRANSVPLVLDFKVIDSGEGRYVKEKRKPGEAYKEFLKRSEQSKTFYKNSYSVMEGLRDIADEIYMTHRYDRRGRCYASGYHVNTQGTDNHKAVTQFKRKELIKG